MSFIDWNVFCCLTCLRLGVCSVQFVKSALALYMGSLQFKQFLICFTIMAVVVHHKRILPLQRLFFINGTKLNLFECHWQAQNFEYAVDINKSLPAPYTELKYVLRDQLQVYSELSLDCSLS